MGSAAKTARNLLLTMLLGGCGTVRPGPSWPGVCCTGSGWQARTPSNGYGPAGGSADGRRRASWRPTRLQPRHGRGARRARSGAGWWRRLTALGGWLFTFHFVCFGWIFFRAPGFGAAWAMLRRLATLTTEHANLPPVVLALLAVGFAPTSPRAALRLRARALHRLARAGAGVVLFVVAIVLHEARGHGCRALRVFPVLSVHMHLAEQCDTLRRMTASEQPPTAAAPCCRPSPERPKSAPAGGGGARRRGCSRDRCSSSRWCTASTRASPTGSSCATRRSGRSMPAGQGCSADGRCRPWGQARMLARTGACPRPATISTALRSGLVRRVRR